MVKNKSMLTDEEKDVIKLQSKLIDFRGDITHFFEDEVIRSYATNLANYYFPKKTNNEYYLDPVVNSFALDLMLAPKLHSLRYMWRYNYDDLDILSNFYKLAQKQNGYWHIAYGTTPQPSKKKFKEGLRILKIKLSGECLEKLWDGYELLGKRSSVACRVIESIAGLPFDAVLNTHYGFNENISERNRRKTGGLGKFRYLRRGREWMAIGSRKSYTTVDLRKEYISNLWGYQIKLDKKTQKIKIAVSSNTQKQFYADIRGILEKRMKPKTKLAEVSNYYGRFFEKYRFANNTNWFKVDEWMLKQTLNTRKMLPKIEGKIFLAGKNFKGKSTYPPIRFNIFGNIKKLNCDYIKIWNPHRFNQ